VKADGLGYPQAGIEHGQDEEAVSTPLVPPPQAFGRFGYPQDILPGQVGDFTDGLSSPGGGWTFPTIV